MVETFTPKPVALTQVDAVDYEGEYEPEPLIVVGPIPGMEGGTVDSVVAGTGITVDDTDPENPEISLTDVYVESVVAGATLDVDATDPANPIISLDLTEITGYSAIATQSLKNVTGTMTWVTDV